MVNLLPHQMQREVRTKYYLKFLAFFFFALAGIFTSGVALLAPSYFLARDEAETSLRYLDTLKQTAEVRGREGADRELKVVAERTAILDAYATSPQAAPILSEIGVLTGKGISLKALEIVRVDEASGTLMLAGLAQTRSDLLAFVKALNESAMFASVEVPLAQLAIDTNLEFVLEFPYATAP